jgi:3-methyladenine DNA glycosylase AlkD
MGTVREAVGGITRGTARDDLVEAVRSEIGKVGDPERAKGQQAYMKSVMPYRGVTAPQLKATLRPLLADPAYRLVDPDEWEATIRRLWDDARFREERYAAIAISMHRLYRPWAQNRSSMPLYRDLVESGAWWDYVDEIASRRIGPVLRAHPGPESERMRTWAVADSLWVRRAAILSQLSSKSETDRQLLLDCITPNLEDREFFIRKAIGWSLRQYAHFDASAADWVRAVVEELGPRLSPLSRREALKHLG